MASNTFQKFRKTTSGAITKMSVKTLSSLEKSKIRMHIDSLDQDVQKLLLEAGEEVYSLWLQGISSNQTLADKMEVIKKKKNEIEQLINELDFIDERDQEILGSKDEAEKQMEVLSSKKNGCPNCGFVCDSNANFCRKCGNKL